MATTKHDAAIREAQARRERNAYAMQHAKQAARCASSLWC